jgi:hypothetical protein
LLTRKGKYQKSQKNLAWPKDGCPSIKTFNASESLNGFLEALRPDLLVFPFAQQEFDRSWRQCEMLWRFSIRASQYKRTISAVLDEAVRAYERGFYIRNDYYNGINFAFLLNVRAKNTADSEEAIADSFQARRVRKEVVKICEDWLAALKRYAVL